MKSSGSTILLPKMWCSIYIALNIQKRKLSWADAGKHLNAFISYKTQRNENLRILKKGTVLGRYFVWDKEAQNETENILSPSLVPNKFLNVRLEQFAENNVPLIATGKKGTQAVRSSGNK